MNQNEERIMEMGVEIKVGDPEHVYNINGINYIPLTHIEEFTDYSRSRVRGLYHAKKLDSRAFIMIWNLLFMRRDYVPALQMMYNSPDKYSRQKYMIDIYYKKVEV